MKPRARVRHATREFIPRLVSSETMADQTREILDAIACRAFEIFDRKGRRAGSDMDDWLQAEAELLHPIRMTVSETGRKLTVSADVAGFRPQDLSVSVEPRRVTISGSREVGENLAEGTTVFTAWSSGAVDLPYEVDTTREAIGLVYERDVLTITLLRVEPAKQRSFPMREFAA